MSGKTSTISIVQILTLLFPVVLSAGTAGGPPVYQISISTRGFPTGGQNSPAGQEAIFRINGNPCFVFRNGSFSYNLNHWIKPGLNTFGIRAVLASPVEVIIRKRIGNKFLPDEMKWTISPDDARAGKKFGFHAGIKYRLDIFKKRNRLPRGISGKTIHRILIGWQRLTEAGQYEEFVNSRVRLQNNWWQVAYGYEKAMLSKQAKDSLRQFRTQSITYIAPEARTIRIIRGRNVILVFSGRNEQSMSRKTLGRWKKGTKYYTGPPLWFAYVNGRWGVWQ